MKLMDRVDILGIWYNNVDMDGAVLKVADLVGRGESSYVVTPNSEIAYECRKDPELRNIVNGAALVLADGAGVVLASKILKRPVKQKVAGVELAGHLLPMLAKRGYRLFLLGAKPSVAERAAEKMKAIAPGLNICGVRDGYFKDGTAVAEQIQASGADVVYVCLGSPAQERWMSQHMHLLSNSVMLGLGGTLDIFAGEAKRAPDIFIKLNLEWFYRLIKQPSRLGRMMRLPKFLLLVFKQKLVTGGVKDVG